MKMLRLAIILLSLSLACGCTQQEINTTKAPDTSEVVSESIEKTDEEKNLPLTERASEETKNYFIEQRDCNDPNAEITAADVQRLWYLVNTVYNEDDIDLVESYLSTPKGAPSWGCAARFVDYHAVADILFTDKGEEQFLSATVGGGQYFYEDEAGACWHLGPWRTGYSYSTAYAGCEILSSDSSAAEAEVTYYAPGDYVEAERKKNHCTDEP